jgi:hypothetical protein
VLAAIVAVATPALGAGDTDRLDQFRALAVRTLGAGPPVDSEQAAAALREMWALLDEEIVESLGAGGVFASLPFLQERLDGFADAWGGASFRLHRFGPLTVGAFQLAEAGGGAAIRVYGRLDGEPALLTTLSRDGRPSVYALPPAHGAAQFLAAWEGAASGRGTRALRLDLVRQTPDGASVVWSTADTFPDGLVVREWGIRGGDVRVRYELRYPGWVPGCEGQTEQEDDYRLSGDHSTFVRAGRRVFNAWHLSLHRVADRVFTALAAGGDRSALAPLVPDPRLRARLPAKLAPDTACDAVEPPAGAATPATVATAALAGDGRPWTLTWRRAGAEWRLTSAQPVGE